MGKDSISVGIVVPTFNSGKYVRECLLSVINQSYKPSQIVVCDDASSDGTLSIVEFIRGQSGIHVDVISHPKNIGIPRNFNSGLSRIEAKYVSLIAGDDVWHEDKLKNEVELLGNEVEGVYSASSLIDDKGMFIGPFRRAFDGARGDVLFEMLMHEMAFRSPLLKTEIVRDIGCFNEKLEMFEDWDLKIKYLSRTKVEYSSVSTVYYRQHPGGISKRADHYKYYRNLKMVYDNNRGLIDAFDARRREEILIRMKRDLLHYLRMSQNLVFSSRDPSLRLKWIIEFIRLDAPQALSFLLVALKRKVWR